MSSSDNNQPRSSFGLRLNLLFAGVVTCVSLVVFLVAYYLLGSNIQQKDEEVILAQLEMYRAWYEQGGPDAMQAHFASQEENGKEIFFVRVMSPEHSNLFQNMPRQEGAFDLSAPGLTNTPDAPLNWQTLPPVRRGAPWLIATTRLSGGQWLQVGKTTEAQAAVLEHFSIVFVSSLVVALTLGVAAGLLMTNRALTPVRQIIAAFRRIIATGKFDLRLTQAHPYDELGQLTGLFNEMLDKNDKLIRGMREALDNVAHDLRTPMTRLRNTAERALEGASDSEAYRNALSDTLEESERVSLMLATLMDISEAETGIMKLDKTELKVADLVKAVKGLYDLVAEEKQIVVKTDVPETVHCFGDRGRLQQVLVNLLDNALKYTPKGGAVGIRAGINNGETSIEVSDTGIGIPQAEIPRIWERLYRGDKSRTERGLGLGLSLVQAIVLAHGGKVSVESEPGKGSTFIVRLPARPVH